MTIKTYRVALPFAALLSLPVMLPAQTTAPAGAATQSSAPRQSGTVKAVTPTDFVLTGANGQDFAVNLGPGTKILLVDPATRDIKSAQPGTAADIAGGDKAIVTGTQGDTGQTLTATRVYLLKSGAIAAMHEQEQAAWARSVGGIVKTADAGNGTLTVANGMRTYTIQTSPNTIVRRYTGASVRFEDAVKSTVAAIRPGDQVQARGQRSPDGAAVTADEIVAGSFSNFSGTLTAVDPTAGTVTLKDLASKKTVTVAVTGQTNLRKLPAGFGQGTGPRAGAGGEGAAPGQSNGASGGTTHTPAQGSAAPGGSGPGSSAAGGQATGGARGGAARMDLSRIINRLPTETTADLKQGDAVMIVASNSDTGQPTAITLLSGVEQILASSPAGGTTLSPWSLGGEGEGGGEGTGGSAGPGAR